MVAFGNLTESTPEVAIQAWLFDVRNPSAQPVVAKVYRGAPTDAQVRRFAHQFADEIISKLGGGLPGIAGTQIAFVSSRNGTKEIWLMDYDGANQHPLTSLRSIALTPRWSPDASRIAFTCFKPMIRVTSAQICMYSIDTGKLVSFPQFKGTNSSPSWSPDGSQIIFSSSMQGNPEIYVSDANGGRPKRLTNSNSANTSATWNPKTGQTVVFVSDRGGVPQLYSMNSDGTSVSKFDLPDMGYVIDPAWSPNGPILAFSWRRPYRQLRHLRHGSSHQQNRRDHPRLRPQRTPQLGSRRSSHRLRIHSRRLTPNLDHAGRRFPTPSTNHHRPQRISQLVAQIIMTLGRNKIEGAASSRFLEGAGA